MPFYQDMQNLAADLLVEFNQGDIKLVSLMPGTGPDYNPGPSTEVITTLTGAVARGAGFKYVSMGLAVASDLQMTMKADGVKPDENDFFEIDGKRFKIISVIAKPAAGIPAVYTCILR